MHDEYFSSFSLRWVQPPRYFWEIYELYNIKDLKFDGVYFPGMLQQIPKLLALFFVVAFGSSLDVAAIQADSPEPLDYNHELKTVGEPACHQHAWLCLLVWPSEVAPYLAGLKSLLGEWSI